MTNFKAIIIADAHIGADKFGASPERWDAPVRQAFEYAVESKADVVISCTSSTEPIISRQILEAQARRRHRRDTCRQPARYATVQAHC